MLIAEYFICDRPCVYMCKCVHALSPDICTMSALSCRQPCVAEVRANCLACRLKFLFNHHVTALPSPCRCVCVYIYFCFHCMLRDLNARLQRVNGLLMQMASPRCAQRTNSLLPLREWKCGMRCCLVCGF